MSKCNNIKKTCNCCNCNHSCQPPSFIQLYDKNLINKLTESQRYLSLSSDKTKCELCRSDLLSPTTNQSFSTGGYTISTTTIKNDTLNLPGPGTYQISLMFKNNALANEIMRNIGSCVNLEYSVVAGDTVYTSGPTCLMPLPGGIILSSTTNMTLLYRTQETNPNMRIYLQEFDFSKVLNNELIVDNMRLIVQKIQDL